MALHVFAATSGNFWEAPRAAIAVKKNVPLEWMELSQLSLYMALLRSKRTLLGLADSWFLIDCDLGQKC